MGDAPVFTKGQKVRVSPNARMFNPFTNSLEPANPDIRGQAGVVLSDGESHENVSVGISQNDTWYAVYREDVTSAPTHDFQVDEIVEFEHGKETFLLSEGWHTGRIINVIGETVTVQLRTRHGGLTNLPIPAMRLRRVDNPESDEIEQPVGEIPDYAGEASRSVTESVRNTIKKHPPRPVEKEQIFYQLNDVHGKPLHTLTRSGEEYQDWPETGLDIGSEAKDPSPGMADRGNALEIAKELFPDATPVDVLTVADWLLGRAPARRIPASANLP